MSSEIKAHVLSIVATMNHGFEGYGEENEDGDIATAYDYLTDVLDINWILDSNRELKGARLLVAFGGPNIWIDTTKGTVEGAWWGDNFTGDYNTDSEFARELDEALQTIYSC